MYFRSRNLLELFTIQFLHSMNIIEKIREGVKVRFSEKGKAQISQKQNPSAPKKSKSRELYKDNEDLGFC